MITSANNPKLALVRALAKPRRREREGLFVTEGEDLLAAGRAAGREPVLLLTAAGAGLDGVEVEPALLNASSALGSGTRALAAWELPRATSALAPILVYLHGVGDPGNVGTLIRSADALAAAQVVIGPGCADPYGPRAARSTMGSIFAMPPAAGGIADTHPPRVALSAHGGQPLEDGLAELAADRGGWEAGSEDGGDPARLTVCLGAERDGLPASVLDHCDVELTIPLRGVTESLNVAAAAAIALHRISSAAPAGKRDG